MKERTHFLLSIWLALFIPLSYSNAQRFGAGLTYLTRDDALSSSNVTCITQDKLGFIWIGTEDGLNRYDGYEVETFRHDLKDSTSLADNNITALYTDSKGRLWIGTKNNGLSRYDYTSNSFENFEFKVNAAHSLNFSYVTSIVEDAHQNLWVSTLMGLNLWRESTQDFEHFLFKRTVHLSDSAIDELISQGVNKSYAEHLNNLKKPHFLLSDFLSQVPNLPSDVVNTILAKAKVENIGHQVRVMRPDAYGKLWLGMEGEGLWYFDPEKGVEHKYNIENSGISSNEITDLLLVRDHLWVATRTGGVLQFDIGKQEFKHAKAAWAGKHIKTLCIDADQKVWIGGDYGVGIVEAERNAFRKFNFDGDGLLSEIITDIYHDSQNSIWFASYQGGVNLFSFNHFFQTYVANEHDAASLTSSKVSALLKRSNGELWVGYYTSGIDVWKSGAKKFMQSGAAPAHLGNGTVFKIFESKKKNIWVCTYQSGLQYYDPSANIFRVYRHDEKDSTSIAADDVRGIAQDAHGNIWVGLHGGGVDKFNLESKKFEHYRVHYPDVSRSLASDWVNTIMVDHHQQIWVGTVSGLSVLKVGSEDFISYDIHDGLSHLNVTSLYEDSKSNIWVGTEGGLNVIANDSIRYFTRKDGLINTSIKGIVEDKRGYIWISTAGGVSCYIPEENRFESHLLGDDIDANEFFNNAVIYDEKNDAVYFGGKKGVSILNPGELIGENIDIPIYITGIQLSGEEVVLDRRSESIQLDADQDFFKISFLALDYIKSEQLVYKYKMEGFNSEWVFSDAERTAQFTNVPPGEYIFKVKVGDGYGGWSSQYASVKIQIAPPLYLTTWAYGLYLILISVIIFFIRSLMIKRLRFKHELVFSRSKLLFFENISHELRTPLSLIVGPLEELRDEVKCDERKSALVTMVYKNSNKILSLVNQLLDLHRLEAGVELLSVAKVVISDQLYAVTELFEAEAYKKSIKFKVDIDIAKDERGYLDEDKLHKILSNLLSNAFKFTNVHGEVQFLARVKTAEIDAKNKRDRITEYLEVRVLDTGVGINEEDQRNVFNRFYKVSSNKSNSSGAGIGLSLVHQLVELHLGIMELHSKEYQGSEFKILLPLNADAYGKVDVPKECGGREMSLEVVGAKTSIAFNRPNLLLVEDNEGVRDYLFSKLNDDYQVTKAENGDEAVELASIIKPDIIITDVMMPGKDGIEVCKILKHNTRTQNIPVILLSANSGVSTQLEGLKEGAVDYLIKPFNVDVLKTKIDNTIKFNTSSVEKGQMPDDKVKTPSFMDEVFNELDKNLSNTEFTPAILAKNLGQSRSALYRKIDEVTGESVSILIRNHRLHRSCDILKKRTDITIKELAYEVGFKDPAYFSTCFKKKFKVSPRDFKQV